MEIFSGDLSSMEQDIKYLLEAIPRCNNKYSSYILFRSLHTLLSFYELLTDNAKKYIKMFEKNKHFYDEQARYANTLYNNSIEAYLKTRNMTLSFSDALFSQDVEFEFMYEKSSTDELLFNENEIYEIVSDYLKKYNESGLNFFDQLIKDKRIYWAITMDNEETCGYTIWNNYMKKNHILLLEKDNNIKLLATLVHELGHVCDNCNMHNKNENMRSKYLSISPFVETLSILEEKRFIEFLIEEGIDKKRSINMLTNLYQKMYDNLPKITVLSLIPDNMLRRDKYASMEKEDFYNNVPGLLYDASDTFLPEPKEYSIIDNPRYGYGTAIAIYLDAIRKADKFSYQEKLSKFMGLRGGYISSDFFDRLGTSIQEMSDIVTDEIEATNKNILIKK